MVKGTKTNLTVFVPTTVPVVTLMMSAEVAQALVDVLARVGGDPDTTRRGLVQELLQSLDQLGFDFMSSSNDKCDVHGNMVFVAK